MVLRASGSSAACVIAASSSRSRSRAASPSPSGSSAIASAWSPIKAGKRTSPCSTARPSSGLRPVRPTAFASARGGARRRREAAAGPGGQRPLPLRQGQRVEALEQLGAILVAHVAGRRSPRHGPSAGAAAPLSARASSAARRRARAARAGRPAIRAFPAARRSAARPLGADQIVRILARPAG